MKLSNIRILPHLIMLSTAVLLAVQVLLIMNSYDSAKKDFYLTAGLLTSNVFFRMKLDNQYLSKLSDELLKIKHTGIRTQYRRIKDGLSQAAADYKELRPQLDTLFKENGINIKYDYAVAISSYIVYKNPHEKYEVVKGGNEKDSLIVIAGNAETALSVPARNTFYFRGDNYFVEVSSYIHFRSLFLYLIGKMSGILLVSLLTTLMIFGVSVFALRVVKKQRKLADEQKDFINNITHEFNTPLNTIKVAGINLRNQATKSRPDEVDRLAAIILRQNTRLQALVENLMKASVLEQEEFSPLFMETSISDIVFTCAGDIRESYREKGIDLTVNAGKGDMSCQCDPFQISAAIYNILDNAAKYSPADSIIEIEVSRKDKFICLSVRDKGIGIKDSEVKSVFKKFYRTDSAREMNVKGLGLGLYFVKKIMDAHLGIVEIHSLPGCGTEVRLLLPEKNEKV